ncbi:hypothetical protein BH10PSE1_BH10PSE1_34890 [soil metagenome]
MSEVRITKIKSPLARQLHEPGGRTVRDATRMAGHELEGHREAVMATITATIDELDAVAAKAEPGTGPRIYQLASVVIDVGGFFETGPLHEAAYSLCDVADRMIGANVWHWPSVRVHLQAMRLILAGGCRAGHTSDALLAGLLSVSQKPVAS